MAGIVGSITHTQNFASAAVALTADARTIGIDSERIMDDATAESVMGSIASAREAAGGCPYLPYATYGTLLFSAKESLFKCLYPLSGAMFSFNDAHFALVDGGRGLFELSLLRDLSAEFRAGTTLRGRYELDGRFVHTGVMLAAVGRGLQTATTH
jgi:enterobactin synthetase component D